MLFGATSLLFSFFRFAANTICEGAPPDMLLGASHEKQKWRRLTRAVFRVQRAHSNAERLLLVVDENGRDFRRMTSCRRVPVLFLFR